MTGQQPLAFDPGPLPDPFGQLAGPVHLPSLTRTEREHAMGGLRDWVAQLVHRFGIEARVIPPCWERHNGTVEALLALKDHERACYADSVSPTAAVDWLRALREVQFLLVEMNALTHCTAHEHRDPPLPLRPAATPGPPFPVVPHPAG